MTTLNENVGIITGGGSGIGRQVALTLAKKGAAVTIADISEEGGQETVNLIEKAGGRALFVKTDVSKLEDIKHYVQKTKETFGKIDMFFNNAGIEGQVVPLGDYPEDVFEKVVDINLKGSFYGLKYVIQAMLENGGGAVVNTASNAGLVGSPGVSAYSGTKHAVVGLTKTAAAEYAGQNIQINAIAPGPTATDMMERFTQGSEEAHTQVKAGIPAGRYGTPAEVANLVVFLLSGEAPIINGAVYPIDGGHTAI
ncbi:SDR family NAD(P)-dependent oxidoreductase [Salsuginibacillus kocurii]|uniref:SDR family NAD(P)-dependent oxidoreductase n=1 Tax=Salsuginibacillus kocurii TaxID=427078 RepID=UPI0003773AEB|nr:glucose 1-dehydrogenase [Salsuginibacillus kocurii]